METLDTHHYHSDTCPETRVLIADGDPLSDQLAEALKVKGCQVRHITSADHLLEDLEADYLILDPLSFSELDFDLFLGKNPSVPVILWSDLDNLSERNRYFKHGIIDILSKQDPLKETCVTLRELFNTIAENDLFHVTFISDDTLYRNLFENLIRNRGYRRCYVENSDTLKRKWVEHEHELSDLIVLDMRNPVFRSESISLIQYLRKERFSEVPVVVILEEKEPNLISKLYREGINDVLIYPCDADEIINAFTHHLDFQISKKRVHYEKHLSSQLKAMIDSSSIVSKADPSGIITYVNDQFCMASGYTKEELIGQPHNIIRHPDNSPLLFKQMWHILQSKQMFHGIMMNRRKDRSAYYVDTTIAPVLNDADEIIEYISIRHDITPLIEKQHEIESKRKKIQNVLDAQTSLICMVDKIKGVENANKSFLDFLGARSLKEFKEHFDYLHDLFLDLDGSIQIQHGERYIWLDQLYDMKGKFKKIAMKDHANNHHIFAIHVEKIPDPAFSDGTCYLVSFEDVTELNRALREAKEASEVESRFLATMSHEIRTPLNGILGFTELIHETSLSDEQRRYFNAVQHSGETLRQIINNILDVMKFSRETPTFETLPERLISELETMFLPFYAQADKKGVKLFIFIDPSIPVYVNTDMFRLKQVLNNLISNAIKFTPLGKTVHIRIKKLAETQGKTTISFTVADEGIGIKEEHKNHIFDPFIQADNSIAREFGGTGLGLNIVLRLVAGLGGRLDFKSIYGKGSVFNVKLSFETDNQHYPYHCRQGKTYLYLPISNPSSRFQLVERYLSKFECCDNAIVRTATLNQIEDNENQAICLFSDMVSLSEISTLIRRFSKTQIYIFPGQESLSDQSTIKLPHVHWIDEPLNWKNLTHFMHIYEEPDQTKAKLKDETSFDGLSILVAEDNEVNRFYIEEVLKKLSISYDIAHDGYAAVKKFINGHYDMVLMDINMPNLDGITATRQILRYEEEVEATHTPIIGLSADAVEKNITGYIQSGLDGYLVKPMRKSDLIHLLKEFFGNRIMHSEIEENKKNSTLSSQSDLSLASTAETLELPLEIVKKLYEKYIQNAHNLIEQLMHPESPEALRACIHSLKGISKNLFIEPLGKECEKLEADLPKLSDIEQISRCEVLCTETKKVIDIMDQELKK